MFYSGASFVTRGHSFRYFDWDRSKGMIEEFMATYDLPDASGTAGGIAARAAE
jgi:4-hydroxyphenylacetate 3-monooxygenase